MQQRVMPLAKPADFKRFGVIVVVRLDRSVTIIAHLASTRNETPLSSRVASTILRKLFLGIGQRTLLGVPLFSMPHMVEPVMRPRLLTISIAPSLTTCRVDSPTVIASASMPLVHVSRSMYELLRWPTHEPAY